jgi:CBS domain-containing protein
MKLMTNRRIRHVPVKDGDRLVGIVSIGDVLKHRLGELQVEADVLRDYAVAARH